jgi:dihydroorotase
LPEIYLIKNAKLFLEGHSFNSNRIDILLSSKKIIQIGENIDVDAIEISGDLHVSIGWLDVRCIMQEPGFEYKESIDSLLKCATAGGFTSVCTVSDSFPIVDSKSHIAYIKNKGKKNLVEVLPLGAISKNNDNLTLSEMYDMESSGAVGFTHFNGAMNPGLLKKALLYNLPIEAKMVSFPMDWNLDAKGQVNESTNTIHTGLKSSSYLAEYTVVQQQIEIAKYCNQPIHFSLISCKESVDLIRDSQKEGLPITADVSIFNLCFTDKEVLDFDENFKLLPFLRTEKDRLALIDGLKDGTISAICSNHWAQNEEEKVLEFDYAAFGAISLQLIYSWYLKYLKIHISMELFFDIMTRRSREIYGLSLPTLEENVTPCISVFDNSKHWIFDEKTNKSLSKNSHEWGNEMKGKVVAVFNKGKVYLDKDIL